MAIKKPSLPIKRRQTAASSAVSSRITNETVAEHRERVLAGGRRFKYPIQYARHKLVLNALLIALVAVVVLVIIGWWQLYIMQNSSSIMYRLTRIVPVPVAVVDGTMVPFSDYLVQYRGSEYYLSKYDEIKLDSADGKKQLDYIKRQALDSAELDTYAAKIAKQKGITVTAKDIDTVIAAQRDTANGQISQETYDASSLLMYGWSPDDYRLAVEHSLLRAKVAFAVDTKADELQKKAAQLLAANGGDFGAATKTLLEGTDYKIQTGVTGLIYNTSNFGGLQVSDVARLSSGVISPVIKSTTDDGYYIVKVIDKNDKQVNFAYIHIPLKQLRSQFDAIAAQNKIHEYITVPKST